jgi:uncharacterized membrane protein
MSSTNIGVWIMALLYVAAGINHFVNPKFYLKIIPPALPFPKWLNWISGAAEIVLGIALFFPLLQDAAAWGIILLLIAVFPANIYHFIKGWGRNKMVWVLALRLPMQGLLIWWAYLYTG